MKPSHQDDSNIAHKAAEWFFELAHGNEADQFAFGAWLRESPRHVEEFLLVTAAYKELEHVSADLPLDLEELRAALMRNVAPLREGSLNLDPAATGRDSTALDTPPSGRDSTASDTPPSGRSTTSARPRARAKRTVGRGWAASRWAALAALVVALIGGGWLLSSGLLNGQSYSTVVGEMRSFELPDGSIIELNTRSQVRVRFTPQSRDIQLVAGEALFKVAHNPARPFRVQAGEAVIQAVGTQFNVYRRTEGTTVSVLEGVVRVSDKAVGLNSSQPLPPARTEMVAAGQETLIGTNGHITAPALADTAKATAWRQRRLVFRADPLAEVAAQFNRYNRRLQIRVEGAVARSTPLTGIFDADDPESLVLFLTGIRDLNTERRGDEVIVERRINEVIAEPRQPE